MSYVYKRETVRYGDEITVVLREAGRLQGLRRQNLVQEALAWLAAQGYTLNAIGDITGIPDEIWQTFLVARFERSACLAAAEEMHGIPKEWLSIEGFARLIPEQLVIDWSNTAYDLNDHWERDTRYGSQVSEGDAEAEKKD